MARQAYDDEYGDAQPAYPDEHPYYEDEQALIRPTNDWPQVGPRVEPVPQIDLGAMIPSVGESSAADPWAGVNLGNASREQAEDFIRRNPGDYGRIASAFADDNRPKPSSGGGGQVQAQAYSGGATPGGSPADYSQYFNQLFQPMQDQFKSYMDQLTQSRQQDQARRQAYEDQVRSAVMGLMNQQPLTADQIATGPEAKAYQRLQERSQQLLRAQNAERAGQMGTGGVMAGASPSGQVQAGGSGGFNEKTGEYTTPTAQPPRTELGGALGSSVERGSRDLAERTQAMQSQLMSRELQGRRDQLMQALQLGAGLMTADQQRDVQRELTQVDASLRNTLGQGGLSLGLLGNLMQNQQFWGGLGQQESQFARGLGAENDRFFSGLGAQLGWQQAMLNQNPFQYLF